MPQAGRSQRTAGVVRRRYRPMARAAWRAIGFAQAFGVRSGNLVPRRDGRTSLSEQLGRVQDTEHSHRSADGVWLANVSFSFLASSRKPARRRDACRVRGRLHFTAAIKSTTGKRMFFIATAMRRRAMLLAIPTKIPTASLSFMMPAAPVLKTLSHSDAHDPPAERSRNTGSPNNLRSRVGTERDSCLRICRRLQGVHRCAKGTH